MWKKPDEKPTERSAPMQGTGRKLRWSASDEGDARITAAALADPDAHPVDELFRRRRGRPRAPEGVKKVPVSIKLDPDVVRVFRETGGGWQTRVNDILRREAANLVAAVLKPVTWQPMPPKGSRRKPRSRRRRGC